VPSDRVPSDRVPSDRGPSGRLPTREAAERRSEGRTELLAAFAAVPDRFAAAVVTVPGDPNAPRPDRWSVREEILHELVVECVVWWRRLDDLAAGADAHWSRTEPELGDHPDTRDTATLLAAFASARAATVARVGMLDDAGWARTGTHAKYGVLDVEGLLRLALSHDEEHLAALG